jgi:hypothetical protein
MDPAPHARGFVGVSMKASIKWAALAGVLVAATAGQHCSSTEPGSDCVKCQCQCQGTSGTATTTFERRNAAGALEDLECTAKGDCVAECARVGAPTPVSSTCLTYQ